MCEESPRWKSCQAFATAQMIHVINVIGLCKSQKAVKRFEIVMSVGQLIVVVV